MTPFDFNDDKLKEECGVFGIFGSADAAVNTALGLHALQHRGQESAGIVSINGGDSFSAHFSDGLVGDNFNSAIVTKKLEGNAAIGHVRYSTAGKKTSKNYQPIFAELDLGFVAIAHNGNLTNAQILRKQLIKKGAIFQSTMDTEVIIHLIALSQKATLIDRIIDAVLQIEGAFSLVILVKGQLIALRDPHGVRPLSIAKLGDTYIVASETCAFDIIGASFKRDIAHGEMVVIDENGIKSMQPFVKTSPKFCIFEYVYFARPDSIIESKSVYEMRKNIGIELAKEVTIDADVVVPVPDSGVPAAIGYALQSKIPFELGIIRNHYVGRTFIEPSDRIRHFGVKLKHNANLKVIAGKKVILVDDSIVRGTTSKKIVQMIRDAGAKEVHMVISSPPTVSSCFYGIDTPETKDLL
ncbi:MAG TPA: amidophosphoribosyltransferase, partial [Rickettsiales bacterium]|nr:amidophosphoribosyltransferase [Rickettsiales bacterium]